MCRDPVGQTPSEVVVVEKQGWSSFGLTKPLFVASYGSLWLLVLAFGC